MNLLRGLEYVLGSIYRYHKYLAHLTFNRCGSEYNKDCPDCVFGFGLPQAKKLKKGKS